MKSFVTITPEGRFALDGRRWFCNSVIYYGHFPGSMQNWFTDDVWPQNAARLEPDFARMAALGINHAALFLKNEMFFDNGRPVAQGYDRLDQVIAVAKQHDVRVTLFMGGFIDTPAEYRLITGREWEHDNRWLPSFNPALFDAYVLQTKGLAERYRHEPAVLGYGDRIDRFYKGFDNVTIPFNLKEEWAAHLRRKFGSLESLREAMGGKLEGDPREFHQVLLPQESPFNASLRNPLGYEYILWQKKAIGDTQARWDAAMAKLAPQQVFWTPFEGCTLDWAMLDGFTPETHKLQAIWMEYYHWQAVRTLPVGPYSEWTHTREFVTQRLHHESPTIYNTAYITTRYVKLSTRRPVVLCHGARLDCPNCGADTEDQQLAMIDRVNAACLAADGDGWHYWCFTDDWQSSLAHRAEQRAQPHELYWQGESMGLYDWEDHPRPVAALVRLYTGELERRVRRARPPQTSEVLLLSSAPLMYSLFRRLAIPTAAAVNGALTRLGVAADHLWTAQNDVHLDPATLAAYELVVIADHMYGRDFRDMPDKLLAYVQAGGTLYFTLDRWDQFADEHGVAFDSPAIRALSGVQPDGWRGWPGADTPCRNWPFPGTTPNEPNFDALAFPRLQWGICPDFRHRAPVAQYQQLLGYRSMDDEHFTAIPGLVNGAEVIAVGKFPTGSKPFVYRHRLGKGTVYVNAWTNNVFRDSDRRTDYGGWEYDWLLALPLETAGVEGRDLTNSAALWLRNTWGYFWKTM
jgi:hypothetical protein